VDPANPGAPLAPAAPAAPVVQPKPTPTPTPDPTPTPTPTPTPDPTPPPTPPPAPPAPIVMHGMCFSPYLTSWSVTSSQMSGLLDKIKPYSEWIRTFGSEGDWDTMLNLAKTKGFKVAAGADIWDKQTSNQNEVTKLISQVNSGKVDQAVVGDEMLENDALTQDQMIGFLRQVRATGVPTSTSQSAYFWLQTPRIIAECDFLTMNIYPFWDRVSIDNAISDVDTQYRQLQAVAGGKKIIVETGWPTAGQTNGQAVPSSANGARYLKDFMNWAKTKNVDYYYFEAFDESWKVEGGCGPHWGLWGTDANLKPEYSAVLNPTQ
jgi:exo-beta-1,3-glucanase (GH17 family)